MAFKAYHPIVNFIYFAAVIVFSCLIMHPMAICLSLICGFAYSAMLNGKKTFKFTIVYMLPLMITAIIINPLVNHQGETTLFYLPDGNPFTLEALIYGISAAFMMLSVICHFSCFNCIMSSDKFIYIFGRLSPSVSLILSMVLRFVPRFKQQIKTVITAQKCIGADVSRGNIKVRTKNSASVLSSMATWSFENAIDTSDSMKSRGFGGTKRSTYTNYRLTPRDWTALLYIAGLITYIGLCMYKGYTDYSYYPSIKKPSLSKDIVGMLISYGMLLFTPMIIDITEVIKWKKLQSET